MIIRGNYLLTSIFVSGVCHIFWLSSVGISTSARAETPKNYTKVSFLGPILEKTAFEMMMEGALPQAETLYASSIIEMDTQDVAVEGPSKISAEEVFQKIDRRNKALFAKRYTVRESRAPRFSMGKKGLFYHIGEKGLSKLIDGPAKTRAILYKPPMPAFSNKRLFEEEVFVTKYKFVLSKDGNVRSVEPLVSTGYPDIDMKCIKYLKQWKFAPRYVSDTDDQQVGIITLDVKVR